MTVILVLLATLFLLVAVFLFSPVQYAFHLSSEPIYEVKVHVGWLGKLLRFRFEWRKGEPYLSELYIAGKLRAGTVKEYQAWLAQKVKDELAKDPEKERDYYGADTAAATKEEASSTATTSWADTSTAKPNETMSAKEEPTSHTTDSVLQKLGLRKKASKDEAGASSDSGETESSSSETNSPRQKLKHLDISWLLEQIFSWEFQSSLLDMCMRMYEHSKPRHIQVEGTIGTGDPAYTAMIQGYLYSKWPAVWGRVQFEYLDMICKGTFSMQGKIYPGSMAWYGMIFAWSRPARDVILHVVKGLLKGGK